MRCDDCHLIDGLDTEGIIRGTQKTKSLLELALGGDHQVYCMVDHCIRF
jgi:hypothetical protein